MKHLGKYQQLLPGLLVAPILLTWWARIIHSPARNLMRKVPDVSSQDWGRMGGRPYEPAVPGRPLDESFIHHKCSQISTEIFWSRCSCIWGTSKDLFPVEREAGGTKVVHVGIRDGVGPAWPLCGPFMFPLGLVTRRSWSLSLFLFHTETGMQKTNPLA